MKDDDFLDLATSALREEPVESSVDPMVTLRRIQSSVAKKNRRVRHVRTFLLPIAATLATSTAFAAATGKLTPVFRAVEVALFPSTTREMPAAPPPPVKRTAPPPAAAVPPSVPAEDFVSAPPASSVADPVVDPAPAPAPVPSHSGLSTGVAPATRPGVAGVDRGPAPSLEATAREKRPRVPSAVNPSPAPTQPNLEGVASAQEGLAAAAAPATVAPAAPAAPAAPPDPTDDLYLRAHQMHFGKADPASTLASWDAYLRAAPNGRFAPEARFNRALVLVKLNRRPEAAAALEPFANGTYGSYRRDEARALLDVLLRAPR